MTDQFTGPDERIQLAWLLRLRWGWIAVQLASAGVAARMLGLPVSVPWVAGAVLLTLASNLVAVTALRAGRAVGERPAALLIALDLVLFTVVLHASGGPENPFGFLYLVPISLAAMSLAPLRSWLLVGLTLLCSAALFWLQPDGAAAHAAHHGAHAGHHDPSGAAYAMHLQGMWLALGVAAAFIVAFVGRLAQALRRRDAELSAMRASAERATRMASLTTLAAGAAHELATPLGTIAVVSKELSRRLADGTPELAAEASVIRDEVSRCRAILDRLSATVGGEATVESSLAELLAAIVDEFPAQDRVRTAAEPPDARVAVPRAAVVTAIRALLQNAIDASRAEQTVELRAEVEGNRLQLTVRDQGAGMEEKTLEHAREPFFTTKPSGRGLGLFLSASVAEQLGGSLRLESRAGSGTTATWVGPARITGTP